MDDYSHHKQAHIGRGEGHTGSASSRTAPRPPQDQQCGSVASSIIRSSPALGSHDGGCFGYGVGRLLGHIQNVRPVVSSVGVPIHQREGATSGIPGAFPVEGSSARQSSIGVLGQRNSSSYNTEERVFKGAQAIADSGEDREPVLSIQHKASCASRGGRTQRSSRQPLKVNAEVVRVEPASRQVQGDMFMVGSSGGRSVRHANQCEDSSVRVATADGRPSGLPNNIVGSVVTHVCVPSDQNHAEISPQGEALARSSTSHTNLSILAQEAMVRRSQGSDESRAGSPESSSLSSVPGGPGPSHVSPQSSDFKSTRSAIIRRELDLLQWGDSAISVLDHALRPQSSAVYERYWSEFASFASSRVTSLAQLSLGVLTAFIHHLAFKRKLKVSTIKSYVSAIKFPLELVLKRDITACRAYEIFMRGLIALFPVNCAPPVTWNLEVVLAFLRRLEPMHSLSPNALRSKCLFLVAVASGRRVSELAHLGWVEPFLILSHSSASLMYTPGFLAKNETPSWLHGPIIIHAVARSAPDPEERYVCPVRALAYWKKYVERNNRRHPVQLFQLPTGAEASSRDISRSLVDVIRRSHEGLVDADAQLLNVRAHDVRAVAASRVWAQRPGWADLAATFNWRNKNVFIDVYSRGITALRSIRSD